MEILVKNIKYNLDTDNKTARVIGYQGELIDVKIPEFVRYKFKKYKVTEIGVYAFSHCKSLISVTFPNSVTEIGDSAFKFCDNLTSVTIPDSVTIIGKWVFYGCSKLASVTIPKSVVEIRSGVFAYCYNLKSITIHDSVTFIGDCAFKYCKRLTSIDIPNSVKFIGDLAFYYCQSLSSIVIPNSVTYIGDSAFSYCNDLTSVNIGTSVAYIGDLIVYNTGLVLPKRYTEDGKLIAYKGFNADMTCRDYQYEEGKTYEIEGEIKLCEKGFHACTNPLDVFCYYHGIINRDIVIHEVYLSGEIDDDNSSNSKVCASKIEIGRRLTIKDINEIINCK